MLTRTVAVIGLAALLGGCKAAAPAETVQQMMKNKVQPTAQIYWDAVRYISDENGSRETGQVTASDDHERFSSRLAVVAAVSLIR